MPDAKIREIVEKAKKQYDPVELKKIKGNLYLYKVTSGYDPKRKRTIKISGEYVGKITSQDLIEPKNTRKNHI